MRRNRLLAAATTMVSTAGTARFGTGASPCVGVSANNERGF